LLIMKGFTARCRRARWAWPRCRSWRASPSHCAGTGSSTSLGWWAVAAGVCLVAACAVWTNQFWLVGYFLFWIWAVVLCVRLLRRPYSVG
jgi:hypothetical protein